MKHGYCIKSLPGWSQVPTGAGWGKANVDDVESLYMCYLIDVSIYAIRSKYFLYDLRIKCGGNSAPLQICSGEKCRFAPVKLVPMRMVIFGVREKHF